VLYQGPRPCRYVFHALQHLSSLCASVAAAQLGLPLLSCSATSILACSSDMRLIIRPASSFTTSSFISARIKVVNWQVIAQVNERREVPRIINRLTLNS
jgi:hypothetical protein